MVDFEALYTQYFDDVYRYARSLCRDEAQAEEITQDTFFKAMQHIGDFHGECRVYVWLCQIAKNAWLTKARQQKRMLPEDAAAERPGGAEPEETYLAGEAALAAQQALHRLEEPYKEVLMLRIWGELPFARIGQLFGKTESWARVTYHRGRQKLKEMVG